MSDVFRDDLQFLINNKDDTTTFSPDVTAETIADNMTNVWSHYDQYFDRNERNMIFLMKSLLGV